MEPTRQVGGVVEHPALSAQASEKTMYLRDDPPADPDYLPLVTAANDTANSRFGGGLEFLDATSDLSHVIFESKVGLTASAPGAAGLYEWQQGSLLGLVSVLPDGTPVPDEPPNREPWLGDGGGPEQPRCDFERRHARVLERKRRFRPRTPVSTGHANGRNGPGQRGPRTGRDRTRDRGPDAARTG